MFLLVFKMTPLNVSVLIHAFLKLTNVCGYVHGIIFLPNVRRDLVFLFVVVLLRRADISTRCALISKESNALSILCTVPDMAESKLQLKKKGESDQHQYPISTLR
ncbi:hypothetical protein QQP08_002244 [Theobroma cacao]|nr:hypothetical protein QQP08_002244 [Theobroma cacao]